MTATIVLSGTTVSSDTYSLMPSVVFSNTFVQAGAITLYNSSGGGGSFVVSSAIYLSNGVSLNIGTKYNINFGEETGSVGNSGTYQYNVVVPQTATVTTTATYNPGLQSETMKISLTIILGNAISSVSISPSGNIYINTAQSITFTASGSGSDSGEYSYQWYLNGNAVSGATVSTYTFSSTVVGSNTVYCVVTDGYGVSLKTSVVSVTVLSVPSISYSVSGSYAEVGQAIQVVGKVSGGSGAYLYQWYVNAGAVQGANANILLYYPTASGNLSFGLQVVDAGLYSQATVNPNGTVNTVSVTAYNPMAVNISPLFAQILNNTLSGGTTSVSINASVSGGSGNYSYQWYDNGGVISGATVNPLSYSSSTSGYHSIYCQITDVNTRWVVISPLVGVNVVGGLSVSLSQTNFTITVGSNIYVTAVASGGSGSYSYQWYSNGSASTTGGTAISGAVSNVFVQNFSAVGTYYYYVVVKDNNTGYLATSNLVTVTVMNGLVASLNTSAYNLDTGISATLTLTVSQGSGNYNSTWYQIIGSSVTVLYSGTLLSSTVVVQNSPITANYYVSVKDNSTGLVYNTNTLAITWVGFSVSAVVSNTSPYVNSVYTLQAIVSGGVGNYSYQWYINGSASNSGGTAISGATGMTYSASQTVARTYYYYVVVSDAYKSAVSNVVTVNVTALPNNIYLNGNLTANGYAFVVGGTATLSLAVASNDSYTAYLYQVYANATTTIGTATGSGNGTITFSVSKSNAGQYWFYAGLIGNNGEKVTTTQISVSWYNSLVANVVYSYGTATVGNPIILTAVGSGGYGNYSYQWYVNGSASNSGGTAISGATGQSYTVVQTNAGNYYYYVAITDSVGNVAYSSAVTLTYISGFAVGIGCPISVISPGGTATITAYPSVNSTAISYIFYQQSPGSGSFVLAQSGTSNVYVFSSTVQGVYSFYVTANWLNNVASSNVIRLAVAKSSGAFDGFCVVDAINVNHIVGGGVNGTISPSGASGNFTVTDNGTVISAYNISLVREINKAGVLEFTVPKLSVAVGDLIQFWFFGNCYFIGYVKEITKNSDYTYDVKAYDGLYDLGAIVDGKLQSPMSVSQMVSYYLSKIKMGSKITGSEITQKFIVDFQNVAVVEKLYQLIFAYNYTMVADRYDNAMLITYGTVNVRTITENSGGYMVISKEYDATRKYGYAQVDAILYDKSGSAMAYSGNPSLSGKEMGSKWLYVSSADVSAGVLQTMANNILAQTSQGQWRVRVYAPTRTPYDIADLYNGAPYVYNLNFADGTSLNNMIMSKLEIRQDGVYYEFVNYNDTVIDLLTTMVSGR